jgi:segregation and condensation protein A
MEFTLKLDRFEGPYTKLLELIESRKLSITEISLASVADDYIAYIKTLDQKNIVDISQFILVASTLMLMKAKSLLPGVVYTEEEEKQVHDLEYKLELYALLTQAGSNIRTLFGKHQLYGRQHVVPPNIEVFVPDERVTPLFLQSIASLTLLSFVTPKALVKVAVEQALRIENVIESLLKRVQGTDSVSLQSLAGDATTKEEQKKLLIVNFIALLELVRAGSLAVTQNDDGGDITISALPAPSPATTL